MTRSKLAIIGMLTATALAASAVYAGKNSSDDEIDDATLAKPNVALDQAITAAEQHTQGKAVQAELEDENGKLVYEVEVMKGATAMDVKIDATTGAVLSAKPDKPDDQSKLREGPFGQAGHFDKRRSMEVLHRPLRRQRDG